MLKNHLTIIFLFLIFNTLQAQKVEFGELNKAEFNLSPDVKFPEANAIVLYRDVNVSLGEYVQVHERIKIISEEGYENATIRIPYPDVGRVKGATYNLIDGNIVETPLDKDLVFEDEEIKGVEFKKFTFPNISKGSIIEFKYKSRKGTGSNINLQYDIPIKKIKVRVSKDAQIGVEILQNPRAFLDVNRIDNANSTTLIAADVPALKPENYVYDMDIYRSYVHINLTAATDSLRVGTWDELIDVIGHVDNFEFGVKPKKFYKDEVASIIGEEKDQMKQTKLLYTYLKEQIKWNDKYGVIPNETVKKIYKEKEGNIAGINILFVSMLKSMGISANPMLISTKLNGIPLTASVNAFNATIAVVDIGGKTYLYDVAHNNSTFDYMASHFLNYEGMRVREDETYDWHTLTKTKMTSVNVIANATIDDDLMIAGSVKERYNGYYAIEMKSDLEDLNEDNIEDVLGHNRSGLELIGAETNTEKEGLVDVQFDFELENSIDEIDGKLYFSPLLFYSLDENPFKSADRKFNVEFGYTFKDNMIIGVKVPEGYKVESVPEKIRIGLPDNKGIFVYTVLADDKNIRISSTLQMNTPIIPVTDYQIIKEFFKARIEKENEKIVLSKI